MQLFTKICAALIILVIAGLPSAVGQEAASTRAGSADHQKQQCVLDLQEFIADWQISKAFTLAVADAMPAESYSFRPTTEEMSFGEQLLHIADANVFRFQQITGVQPPYAVDFSSKAPADKQAVLKRLEQSFDYVLAVLPSVTPEQLKRTWHIPSWKGRPDPDGRAMIMNMFVHTAHHRAQCDVYLRLKGIKPPDYTF